jgi:hypothetical protein
MTIVVADKGGLGNILFQIAAAVSLALRTGHAFAVVRRTRDANERPDIFDCMIRSATISGEYPFSSIELDPIGKTVNTFAISESTFRFSPIEIPGDASATDVIILSGYFQSAQYFIEEFAAFDAAARFSVIQDTVRQEIAHAFPTSLLTKAASLHFRLGDYKNLQEYHPVLPYEYYRNAVQTAVIEVSTNVPIENILYFCETEDSAHAEAFISRLSADFCGFPHDGFCASGSRVRRLKTTGVDESVRAQYHRQQ